MNDKRVFQIGIVVKNIRTATEKWVKRLNLEMPELFMTFAFERTGARFRGEPCRSWM